MPLLSIIITVYNLENYIEECLKSVLEQDTEDYEIILVDNASTDNSRKICEIYAEKYSQIKFIGLEGESIVGRAHRVGRAEANGEYIHMLDGDDYVAKGCYSEIIEIIKQKSPDAIIGSFKSICEEKTRHINDAVIISDEINKKSYEEAIQYIMSLPNFHMVQWRYIFKKSTFAMPDDTRERLYSDTIPSSYYGDVVTSTRILIRSKALYYYDNDFYYYRIRAVGSITSKITFGHYKSFFTTIFNVLWLMEKLCCDEIHRKFIFSRVKNLLTLFSSGIDLIGSKELDVLSAIVNENINYIYLLEECQDDEIKRLYNLITHNGSYEGINLYCKYKKSQLFSSLHGKEDKYVYIFPSGHWGESTARILGNNGINICGFIDNDEHKNGNVIMGLKCSLPNYVIEYNRNKIKDVIIVISTIYNDLRFLLKKQMIELGFSQEQIIIRE